MQVRLATISDKEKVLGLLDEFSAMLGAHEKPSEIGGEIFDEIVCRKDTLIFVADDNGTIVGMATFYLLPNLRHGWHRGHIEDFFVTDSQRGKGVGKMIFEEIKNYCKKNGIKVIKLDSGNNLPDAHKFYEKLGGKTTERFFRFDVK